jgi:hypothetical protein
MQEHWGYGHNSNIVLGILSSRGIGTRQWSPVRRVLYFDAYAAKGGRTNILNNNG